MITSRYILLRSHSLSKLLTEQNQSEGTNLIRINTINSDQKFEYYNQRSVKRDDEAKSGA